MASEQYFTPAMKWSELAIYCHRFRECFWTSTKMLEKKWQKPDGTSDCFAILMQLDLPDPITGFPVFDSVLRSKLEETILEEGDTDQTIVLVKKVLDMGNRDAFIYIFYDGRVLPIPNENEYQRQHCQNWLDFNNLALIEASRIYGRPYTDTTGDVVINHVRSEFLNLPELPKLKSKQSKKERQLEELNKKRVIFIDGNNMTAKKMNGLLSMMK